MKTSNFSIITCTYNSAGYLKKNISSAKEQNYADFEHIFIDGFSTDDTLKIIKEYQAEFPNKVKIFQYKPEGISKAMNQGIEKSNGRYLIHLHSDDSFFDGKVLTDVSKLLIDKNYPDWIYGKINTITRKEAKGIFPIKRIWQKEENNSIKSYLLKFYNYIPHQAVFIKKDVFEQFGYFDEKLKIGMDPDLWLRLRCKTRWFFYDRIISNFSLRPDAQSSGLRNKEVNIREISLMKKRYLNKFEILILNLFDFLLRLKQDNYQK